MRSVANDVRILTGLTALAATSACVCSICCKKGAKPEVSTPNVAASLPSTEVNRHRNSQVGGHAGTVIIENKLAWKLLPTGSNTKLGLKEVQFLKDVSEAKFPGAAEFIPKYHGLQARSDGLTYMVMENILHGLAEPAAVDVKIGHELCEPDADPVKVQRRKAKAMSTTSWTLGAVIVGAKYKEARPDSEWRYDGYTYNKPVTNEDEMRAFFGRFLCTVALREHAINYVKHLLSWFEQQRYVAFKSSSILMAWDTAKLPSVDALRFKMIDFAHVHASPAEGDRNYIRGLQRLLNIIQTL